jgi:hypothetical protein
LPGLALKQLKERRMALLSPVMVDGEISLKTPLAKAMNEIRIWLDNERIEPAEFRTIVSRAGLEFEISFHNGWGAERFQARFASLPR